MQSSDVAVVGGGIIGATVAWRCAQHGLTVTVVDPEPDRGAWHTAAGMLAPTTELHVTETSLLTLNQDALARYPAFVAELEDELPVAGAAVGYRRCGAVAVAWDGADLAALHDLQAVAARLDVDAQLLTGRDLRALEPSLAPGLPGGLLAPGDHQVDPRRLHAAVTAAAARRGVRSRRSAGAVRMVRDRVAGVTLDDGTELTAGTVVLAAGAWPVPGVPADAAAPVRPVKGQTLRLTAPGLALDRIVRASVRGTPVYVVPRGDGRFVVGASVEEVGFDDRPRAGAVYELLRDAQAVLPELDDATLDEVCVGFRPGSPDNAPVIGRTPVDGLLHATGHYRNGILLAPLTADAIAGLVVDGKLPDVVAGFGPERFAS